MRDICVAKDRKEPDDSKVSLAVTVMETLSDVPIYSFIASQLDLTR